jgi:hypothetical protein
VNGTVGDVSVSRCLLVSREGVPIERSRFFLLLFPSVSFSHCSDVAATRARCVQVPSCPYVKSKTYFQSSHLKHHPHQPHTHTN